MQGTGGRESPRDRLEEGRVHVFSADDLRAKLRAEPEYASNQRNGIALMKTDELRVVLEIAEAGAVLDDHVVQGPATIFVVEGRLEVETPDGSHAAARGEMMVIPAGKTRRIECREDSTFLLALSPKNASG